MGTINSKHRLGYFMLQNFMVYQPYLNVYIHPLRNLTEPWKMAAEIVGKTSKSWQFPMIPWQTVKLPVASTHLAGGIETWCKQWQQN